MTEHTVYAEYDRLDAVRIHTPGLELWSGALDPTPNLFDSPIPPEAARREHERLVETLESAGVDVHQLADDLAAGGFLDDFVAEYAGVPDDELDEVLTTLDPREKLHLALARAAPEGDAESGRSVRLDRPISNTFFQRDTTLVGDKGPVLCSMGEAVRQAELPFVRRAWEAVSAEFVYEMDGPLEGGEFLPAGEFALLGVSADVGGEEVVIRTTYDAGTEFLESGAVGYDEVGLVRAPLEADERLQAEHGTGTRILHLLGWLNIAAEGLAVADTTLARHAEVDVYVREGDGDGYALDRSMSTLEYLDSKGYDVVDAPFTERWATNFLAIEGGRIVPLYEPDEDGAYRPENNQTIERLKERGVDVVPDGTGLPVGALTRGAGGIHCMTTPLGRS